MIGHTSGASGFKVAFFTLSEHMTKCRLSGGQSRQIQTDSRARMWSDSSDDSNDILTYFPVISADLIHFSSS